MATTSQVFTTTGSQTWNWPTGVTSVTAECLGAGGGSGDATGNPATGGGGKGGGYARTNTITKGAESLLTINVGAPGAVASAGGFSSVVQSGTTVCLGTGGGGGASMATSSANGAGGTTLNGTAVGDVINNGGNGGTGAFAAGSLSGAGGGGGGPTSVGGAASGGTAGTAGTGNFLDGAKHSGAGAAGVTDNTVGSAAPTGIANQGGGASGGKANSGADRGGWSGRQGIVVLTWTPPDQAVTTLNIASTAVLNVASVSPDILVAGNISTATARGMRSVVFPSPLVGYVFFFDSTGALSYSKTTDGGVTWGAAVAAWATGPFIAFDIWFDQWTPGDNGNLIHFWVFDSSTSIIRYRQLDTTSDTLGTIRTVFSGASAVAGRGAFVSGTKTRSGYLYCAYDIDAGTERGLQRSTDGGANWSANLATTFMEATLDTCKLYPASGTGDNNDCWALYYDDSALALTLKMWDSSAVAQVESATIGVAHTDGPTDLTGQFGYDAVVRHSDGHLIAAALSGRDVAASQHQVFDITSTSTITTKTAIAASTDDHYYPQVFINQGTGTIFVAYNGKRDGSEVLDTATKIYYTYSLNGGTTWNAGDSTYMDGAAVAVQQVWNGMSGQRFYTVWRVGTTLWGNFRNSLVQLGAQGATIDPTAVLNAPTVLNTQLVTTGTCTSTAILNVPTVLNTQLVTTSPVASTAVLNIPSVSGGAAPTNATDTFDRADSSTLGANWTNTKNNVKILGNEACGGLMGQDCLAYRSAETFNATTHASEATFRQHAGFGADTISYLTVRHQANGDHYGLWVHSVPGDRRLSAVKYISGVWTGLGDYVTGAPNDGEVYKFEVTGSTLRAYKNGVQQGGTFTDSTLTGGAPGLGHFYNPAEWDDWTGYGVTGGSVPSDQSVTGTTIASASVLNVPTISLGSGGTTTAMDDFNRVNASTLGANWTDTTAGIGIVSNEAKSAFNGSDRFAYRSAETYGADQACEMTVRLHGVASGDIISYLTCRHKSNGDFYALQVHSVPGDRRLSAVKRIGGVYTGLGDFGGNVPVEGDVYKFEVTGSSLKCYKNGTQVGSAITDTSITSGGAPGIGSFYPTAWDDWTGYGVVTSDQSVSGASVASTLTFFPPTIIPLSTDDFNVGGSQPWTLVVRCKFESQPTSMGVALKLQSGMNAFGHWGIYWNNTDGFVARVRTASQEYLAKATAHATLTLGATYVVAAGYDPSTTTVWVRVNSETRVSVSVAGSTMDTSDSFLIGAALQTVGVQWPLDGAIGPVTYLKRVLSDAELDHWIAVKGDYASITGTGLTMLM